jgi:hypothetical protein
MTTDSFFALAIAATIALFLGADAMRPLCRIPVRHRAEAFRDH